MSAFLISAASAIGGSLVSQALIEIGKTIKSRCGIIPKDSLYPPDTLIRCKPKIIIQKRQIGDDYSETIWTAHLLNRKGTIKWTRNGRNWGQT